MKTKILTILVPTLGLIVCLANAAPMGTVFTYQGRLIEDSIAANGLYDFRFELYDDPNAGAKQEPTVDINDTNVVDGYFTVELDFGSDVFNGDARWLDIGVRPTDSNDPNYTPLSPRQEVTPTPYALQTKGIFVDSNDNVGIGTTGPEAKLQINGNEGYNALYISTVSSAPGTSPPAIVFKNNLAGDNNDFAVEIDYQGRYRVYRPETSEVDFAIDQNGSVGIGTTNPQAKLDVSSIANGFLPPRMTTAQMNTISSPPEGLMIYNTTTHQWMGYNGTGWVDMSGGGKVATGSYAGNGVDDRSITGVGFQPDTVMIYSVAEVANGYAVIRTDIDSASKELRGNAYYANCIQALESDGFQIGTDGRVNTDEVNYTYICWKK